MTKEKLKNTWQPVSERGVQVVEIGTLPIKSVVALDLFDIEGSDSWEIVNKTLTGPVHVTSHTGIDEVVDPSMSALVKYRPSKMIEKEEMAPALS